MLSSMFYLFVDRQDQTFFLKPFTLTLSVGVALFRGRLLQFKISKQTKNHKTIKILNCMYFYLISKTVL